MATAPIAAPAGVPSAGTSGYVQMLLRPEERERALQELSKNRENMPELAPTLWYTPGVIAALVQEVMGLYPHLSAASMPTSAPNRVCNALALLQCIASHRDTRVPFVRAHIPLLLYPFLSTVQRSRAFEYLRLTSLGVIGALVKADEEGVGVHFLLETDIASLCLPIMESGSELSKTVATFVIQKILLTPVGLAHVTASRPRFVNLATVLARMISALHTPQSDRPAPQAERASPSRLLKHGIRCLLRLSEAVAMRGELRACIPAELRGDAFATSYQEDSAMARWRQQLLEACAPPT